MLETTFIILLLPLFLALAPGGCLHLFLTGGSSGETTVVEEEEWGSHSPPTERVLFHKKLRLWLPSWPRYFCVSLAPISRADLAWECFPLFQILSSCWVTAVFIDTLWGTEMLLKKQDSWSQKNLPRFICLTLFFLHVSTPAFTSPRIPFSTPAPGLLLLLGPSSLSCCHFSLGGSSGSLGRSQSHSLGLT